MRSISRFSAVAAVVGLAAVANAQDYGGAVAPALAIPDGVVCGTPGTVVTHTINVPDSITITDVDLTLGLTHTWYGDLGISVTHGATTVVLALDQTPDDSSNLMGNYRFDDEAAITLDAASLLVLGGAVIAPGSYRGDNPLTAFDTSNAQGDWIISLSDACAADVGSLNNAVLHVVPEPASFGLLLVGALAAIRRRHA